MKFRKKPVVVEAFQWNGSIDERDFPEWFVKALEERAAIFLELGVLGCSRARNAESRPHHMMVIRTLEGAMEGRPGDWIIKGVKGELYPCKPDIFEMTYESVEE